MSRPIGSKNKRTVFLNNLLDDYNVNWRKILAKAIKKQDAATVAFYVPLLPFLLSKMVPKDFVANPADTPLESLENAKRLMEQMNGIRSTTDGNKNVLGEGTPPVQT